MQVRPRFCSIGVAMNIACRYLLHVCTSQNLVESMLIVCGTLGRILFLGEKLIFYEFTVDLHSRNEAGLPKFMVKSVTSNCNACHRVYRVSNMGTDVIN